MTPEQASHLKNLVIKLKQKQRATLVKGSRKSYNDWVDACTELNSYIDEITVAVAK